MLISNIIDLFLNT